MKKYVLFILAFSTLVGCQGQETKKEDLDEDRTMAKEPKGSWKVNREFDESGNLIRYDSIYTYSSTNEFDDFTAMDRDSIFQSFRSQFSSSYRGFDSIIKDGFFTRDSLFMKNFFADDFFESEFGKDFMNLDEMHKRMQNLQRQFLERHHSEFKVPENLKEEF